jgi:uncharacterized protein (DUF58 family)
MFFGTRNCFKSVLASKLAALLAWSSVQHDDRVGYLVFSEHQHSEFRPARGKRAVLNFIQQLVAHPAWNRDLPAAADPATGLKALSRLRHVTRPGSLVIMLSDFRFFDPACRGQLVQLARHNDVLMIHVFDRFERELPGDGFYRVTDGEASVDIDASSARTRARYHERYEQRQQALERLCQELGLFLIDIETGDDMLAALKTGLGLAS